VVAPTSVFVDYEFGRNVLKERKLRREIEAITLAEPTGVDSPEPMPAPPSPHIVANVKPMHAPARNTRVTDMASYKARWHVSSTSVIYRAQ